MNGACENVHAKCSLHNLPAKVVVTITAISLYNSYNVWSCWMLCAHSIIDIHVCVRVFHCVLLTLILPSLSSRSYSFTLYSHVRKICVRVVSPRSKCRREMSYYFLSLFLSLSLSLSCFLSNLSVLPSQRISALDFNYPSLLSAFFRRKIPICVCLTLERLVVSRSNATLSELAIRNQIGNWVANIE